MELKPYIYLKTPYHWVKFMLICTYDPAPTALVQTVASYSDLEMHFIASGLSNKDYNIKIWCKLKKKTVKTPLAVMDPSLGVIKLGGFLYCGVAYFLGSIRNSYF